MKKRKLFGCRLPNGKSIKSKQIQVAKPLPRPKVSGYEVEARIQEILAEYIPWVTITPEKRDYVMSIPQQLKDGVTTNIKWKEQRRLVGTGSRASSITGYHKYDSLSDAILKLLWNTFTGNWRTEWGKQNEPNAAKATLELFQSHTGMDWLRTFPSTPLTQVQRVEHKDYGLIRSQAFPFAGTSPDGVIVIDYTQITLRYEVEFKCRTRGQHHNEWPTNQWPSHDLYDLTLCPDGNWYPIQIQYYVQIMWCVLIMGKFNLEDIFKIQGKPEHFAEFKAFMESHVEKAKAQGIRFHGEDLCDSNVPIMFVVWVPGNTDTPHVGEPEIYRKSCYDPKIKTHRSVMAKTSKGCIQATLIPYNHEFAMKILQHVYYFWKNVWVPRIVWKEKGILQYGEIDIDLNYFIDQEEIEKEEEVEIKEDEDHPSIEVSISSSTSSS